MLQHSKDKIYLEKAHDGQLAFHKANNRVRIVFGGNRCLAEGTLVATPSGPRAIEELQPGDFVYGDKGDVVIVKEVFFNGLKEVADIMSRKGVIATCTKEHVWLTSTWREDPRERSSGELTRDVGIERRTFKSPLGPVRQEQAYTIGAFLGNGCKFPGMRDLQFSSPDASIPEKIARSLGTTYRKSHPTNYTYLFQTKNFVHYDEWMRGRYAHEKIVDMGVIRTWDRQSLVEFVAGVYDTDGSLTVTEGKITFSVGMQAKSVIDALHYACLALWQLDLPIHVDNRDKYKNGPVYVLTCSNISRSKEMLKELDPHVVSPQKKWREEYGTMFGMRTRDNAMAATWGRNPRLRKTYDIHVDSPNNLYCLANGLVTHNSGKSSAGVNEMRWLAEGTHPFRPYRTPIKACIVCQDFQTHAKDVIVPKINEWFPPGLIVKAEKNQANVECKFYLKNGSTIDIKSHDQDIKVFEGSDYDVVWYDEPPPRPVFTALWRGLTDRRGICFITGTPITEPWLADLYAKASAEDNKGLYWASFMDIEQNATNLGEGNAEEGRRRIAEFLDAIDDTDERETRKTGKMLHMRGLIFKGWGRATHLVKHFKWPARWPIIASLDPHPRKDWALSFLGITPSNNKILISSYYVPGVVDDVARFCIWARDQIELDGPGVPYVVSAWIDNYASVESMILRDTTILEELNRLVSPAMPKFKPAPKNVDEKISIFKNWLAPKETKYGKRPDFLAFDVEENKDFIKEIEGYVWARQRGTNRNTFRNVPVKENDDILDTIMQVGLVLDSKSEHLEAKAHAPIIKYAGRV